MTCHQVPHFNITYYNKFGYEYILETAFSAVERREFRLRKMVKYQEFLLRGLPGFAQKNARKQSHPVFWLQYKYLIVRKCG